MTSGVHSKSKIVTITKTLQLLLRQFPAWLDFVEVEFGGENQAIPQCRPDCYEVQMNGHCMSP